MPDFSAAVLIVLFSFGQTIRFSLFSPEVRFSFLDIGVFILTCWTLVLNHGLLSRLIATHRRVFVALLVFLVIAVVSLITSGPGFGIPAVMVGGLYLLRFIVYSLLPFILATQFTVAKLRRLLIFLGLSVTLIGLYQYAYFPDIRHLTVLEWDPHYYRVVGTWLDPGFTGLLLVFSLIYLSTTPFLPRLGRLLAWAAGYLGLALTYSRSSYLAFLLAFAYLSWQKRSASLFIAIISLFALTLYLLPRPGGEGVNLQRTNSILARVINWRQSLVIFYRHPILGVGFNTYRAAQLHYGLLSSSNWQANHAGAGADSSLLFVAATTGIIGLVAYLRYWRVLFNFAQASPTIPPTFIAVLVHGLFLNSLFYPPVLLWLGLLLAIRVRTSD